MPRGSGFSARQVRAIVLATVVITALVTHWVDRSTRLRRDEVTGRELAAAAAWLDDFYASPDGLQRDGGLCSGGRLDRVGLSAWLFDGYFNARERISPEQARADVLNGLRQSDEWRRRHSR